MGTRGMTRTKLSSFEYFGLDDDDNHIDYISSLHVASDEDGYYIVLEDKEYHQGRDGVGIQHHTVLETENLDDLRALRDKLTAFIRKHRSSK